MTSPSPTSQDSIRPVTTTPNGQKWRLPPGFALAYVLLVVYGSLFPFVGWRLDGWLTDVQGLIQWPLWRPRSDMITNLLVYIPVGALLSAVLHRPHALWQRGALALLLAVGLSLSMELLQAALPNRVASLRDLAWNSLGATIGVACRLACADGQPLHRRLTRLRRNWLRDDVVGVLGGIIISVWLLSQWLPLSADLDLQRIETESRVLWFRLHQILDRPLTPLLIETMRVLSLGMIWLAVTRRERRPLLAFALLVAGAAAMQILLIDRRLAPELPVALVLALPLLGLLSRARGQWTWLAFAVLLGAIVLDGTYSRFPWGVDQRPFNWIPFVGNMGRISNLSSLADTLWLYASLAFWAILLLEQPNRRGLLPRHVLGGLGFVLGTAFAIEWFQTHQPDRWADVTDPLVAGAGWLTVIWLYRSMTDSRAGREPQPNAVPPDRSGG